MAEKYGEKPEKFTAKFFEYIWNYYKWYIIAFIVAIVLGVFTVFQIRNTPSFRKASKSCVGNFAVEVRSQQFPTWFYRAV